MVEVASGSAVAEGDLLAHADGQVITAEAKCSDSLGDTTKKVKMAARKRVLLAAALRADEVIMATTAGSWAPSSIDAMRGALTAATWPRGFPPRLRTVTALGAGTPEDLQVDLPQAARHR